MRLALGHLRITPRDFWSLTMPELHAIFAAVLPARGPASRPLDRAALDALIASYPD